MGDQHERHEPVAGNGLLHRRMFLAAGAAAAAGASAVPSGVRRRRSPVEPWMKVSGRRLQRLRPALEIRGEGRAHLGLGARHRRHRRVAHPASAAQRHDHAERPALRAHATAAFPTSIRIRTGC